MSKAAYLLTSLHAALVILPALAQLAARETAEALGYNTRSEKHEKHEKPKAAQGLTLTLAGEAT